MSEHQEHNSASQDDQFAAYVDRLLAEDPSKAEESHFDSELYPLAATARRLKDLMGRQPPETLKNRIYGHLVSEWRRSQRSPAGQQAGKESWLHRLSGPKSSQPSWQSRKSRSRSLFLRFGFAAVVVLVLALFVLPPSGSVLSGTARGGDNLVPIWVGVIVLIGIGIAGFWFYDRNH